MWVIMAGGTTPNTEAWQLMSLRHALFTLFTAGAVLAGCGSAAESGLTSEEAVKRVAARAEEAVAHLPAGASLEQTLHQPDVTCDDHDRDGPVFVETNYRVVYPPGWPVDDTMATISGYWSSHGYRIVRDDRDNATHPELVVEKKDDGFRIGYLISHRANGAKDVFINSSSPCFQP